MAATDDNDPTLRGREPAAGQLCLLVSADGILATHPLPQTGELALGRGADCAIRIDHPSVSRRHALLRIGDAVEIEDLGSANGTRVQDRSLAPGVAAPVAVGDVIDLGSVMLVVRRASTRSVRVWPHGHFEGRLAGECARGDAFAVIRLGTPAGAPVDAALGEILGPLDVVALYAPGEHEILVPGATPDEASELAARLVRRLARQNLAARTGVACHPQDGVTAERLIATANAALRAPDAVATPRDAVYDGVGPRMKTLLDLVERVAPGNLGVLISGETGAGKEIIAELIHRRSPRAERTFLRLHCAAISEALLESELFGHERGAFTGAHAAKPGLLETADGGTVFLDEIGELPPATQVKLLRVLEERSILRIGGLKPRPVDVRFVAATNRDLAAEVLAGRFRRDLFFRLNGISLVVPPLRERREEIVGLARHFAAPVELSPEALALLLAHPWPGNVRELRNTIDRAILLCGAGPIRPEHLTELEPSRLVESSASPSPAPGTLRAELDTLERDRIEQALEEHGGNQTRAARALGISRGTLIARLASYGLTRPRKR